MLSVRGYAALTAAKLSRVSLRATGRGATTLPGLVALTLDPRLAGDVARRLPKGVVLVTGTNGKTTTSRMLADVVRLAGWHPVHNRSGSNLARGIAAALVADATWLGEPRADGAVFEVDEASIVAVAPSARTERRCASRIGSAPSRRNAPSPQKPHLSRMLTTDTAP